jgi:NAD(P)-dependent dehydrogenase (short-subunit alcohol dehydrogenase family)
VETVRFDGQVALITGAGNGLGRAYALWMAARGARVVVNNRTHPDRPSSARAVVDEIRAAGGFAVAEESPVEDPRSGRVMVDAALAEFGSIDIVISNAGVLTFDDRRHLDVTELQLIMDINFWGSVHPVIAALPLMEDQGYGRIVMTTSGAGMYGQSRSAAYSASRAAVIGFARSLAVDTHDTADVHVNVILPSGYTNASKPYHDPAHADFMSPAKVAPVVGWLASFDCRHSGLILHAGCGRVRRAKVVEGPVLDIPDEDLRRCWPALEDMTDATEATYSGESGRALRPEIYNASDAAPHG